VALVTLRAPLKDLAGGNSAIEVEGHSVFEVLRELERAHPKIKGWVLDEHGDIRRHVNVFVNDEMTRKDAPLSPDDRLHVLPSITGGAT